MSLGKPRVQNKNIREGASELSDSKADRDSMDRDASDSYAGPTRNWLSL